MMPSRILTAVPRTWQVRLEIVKAIRELAAQKEEEQLRWRAEASLPSSEREFAVEIVREFYRELCKAGFNLNEPRVPGGNPGGGQWTKDGGNVTSNDPHLLSDATPDNTWQPGAQYAANDGLPPEVPEEEPATAKAVNTFLKAVAYWLACSGLGR